MKITGNTVLITGGATGIGFALARHMVGAGNDVIICGRRRDKLDEAQSRLPAIHTMVCDVAVHSDRVRLFNHIVSEFKSVNILVNNAGIQRMINLKKGLEDLMSDEDEIEINLGATIYLSAAFIPHLMKEGESAIVNISSGLGFIPIALFPVYCATKAAIHSYSISMRYQLRNTSIKVFEIIPPTVDTGLDRGTRARRGVVYRGIEAEEVAVEAMKALEHDKFEYAIGQANNLLAAAKSNPEQFFNQMNH
jgi:uncharacterized oxidoreductase